MIKRIAIIIIILLAAAVCAACSANAEESVPSTVQNGAAYSENAQEEAADDISPDDPKLEVLEDSLVDGGYTRFLLTAGDNAVYFEGNLVTNRSAELFVADLTGDGVGDIVVMLTEGAFVISDELESIITVGVCP